MNQQKLMRDLYLDLDDPHSTMSRFCQEFFREYVQTYFADRADVVLEALDTCKTSRQQERLLRRFDPAFSRSFEDALAKKMITLLTKAASPQEATA